MELPIRLTSLLKIYNIDHMTIKMHKLGKIAGVTLCGFGATHVKALSGAFNLK